MNFLFDLDAYGELWKSAVAENHHRWLRWSRAAMDQGLRWSRSDGGGHRSLNGRGSHWSGEAR